jgi:hypothetical protein
MKKDKWLTSISPRIGYYIAGFVDGEGSFNVSVRKGEGYRYGWQFGFSFNVSQKDKIILILIRKYLGCGRLKQRKDGLWSFVVENQNSLIEKVIPFFERFNFLSSRMKTNFSLFKRIMKIAEKKEHIDKEGIKKVLELREKLNEGKGRKRKYNLKDVNLS